MVNNDYEVATERMPLDDKLKILEQLGRKDLIEIFKEWKPRQPKKSKSAPLDQRVSITVTAVERVNLDNEVKTLKKSGQNVSLSQIIRSRALGNIDINGWREIAEKALKEIEEIESNEKAYNDRIRTLNYLLEEEEDDEQIGLYEREISEISIKLQKIVAKSEKRNNRLSGRMTMKEAETVKWRAERLCISASDYLRMIIFNLIPNTSADAHLSLAAKKRFYISIIDVSENGWGENPNIYNCSQCANYVEELTVLKDRLRQLESF